MKITTEAYMTVNQRKLNQVFFLLDKKQRNIWKGKEVKNWWKNKSEKMFLGRTYEKADVPFEKLQRLGHHFQKQQAPAWPFPTPWL